MNPQEFLNAMKKAPTESMVPIGVTQELLGLSRSAILDRVKDGRLSGVSVTTKDGSVYRGVTLASLVAYQASHPEAVSDDALAARIEKHISRNAFFTMSEATAASPVDLCMTYSQVMEPLGMSFRNPRDRSTIGRVLGQMSVDSLPKDGFLISALIVRKATGQPGPGFYDLARDKGLLKSNSPHQEREFWRSQLVAIRRFFLAKMKKPPAVTE